MDEQTDQPMAQAGMDGWTGEQTAQIQPPNQTHGPLKHNQPAKYNRLTDHLTNESINQSINQSVTQSASQSVNQSVSQSISQSIT